jgi:two-component system, chemotaxis family, sensor histidine kinase and response regulator PixL
MLIDSNIRDQAYQFFIQESLEFLQTLEEGLLNLQQAHDTPEIHALMRAAHSIKGGAASVGLEAIKKIAHQMEDVLRALYKDGVVIDAELEELLLQAYDCLRTPLIQQIQTGESDAEHWLEQSEVIFAQLVEKLGDAMFGESELPTAAELGIDIVQVIFSGDVEEGIQRLEQVLQDSGHPEIAGELRAQAQVFIGVGELVNLAGFVSIAKTAEAAIDAHSEKAREIVEIAVKDFRAGQSAVLAGDRATGGAPSAALLAWISAPAPTAVAPLETPPALPENNLTAMDMSIWAMDDDDDDFSGDLVDSLGDLGTAMSLEALPTLAVDDSFASNDSFAVNDNVADDDVCQILTEANMLPLAVPAAIAEELESSEMAIEPAEFVDLESIADEDGDRIEFIPIESTGVPIEQVSSDVLRDTLSNVPIDEADDEPDIFDTFSVDLTQEPISIAFAQNSIMADDDDDDSEVLDWSGQAQLSMDDFVTSTGNAVNSIEDEVTIISQIAAQAEELTTSTIEITPHPESTTATNIADDIATDAGLLDPASALVLPVTAESARLNLATPSVANNFGALSEMMDDLSEDLSELSSWPMNLGLATPPSPNPSTPETPPTSVIPDLLKATINEPIPSASSSLAQTLKAAITEPPKPDDDDMPTQALAKPAPRAAANAADAPMLSNSIRVDLSRLDRLNNLVGEMVSQENSAILQNQQLKEILNTVLQRVGRFDKLTKELRTWMDGSQTARSQLTSHSPISSGLSELSSQFDPLQMDDYSDLSMLMQETIDEIAQVGEAMRDMTMLTHHSQQTQRQKQQTLRQVRNDLLWARMLPIGDILQRFPRMVRDMSMKYSKTVAVKLTGTNTLVDKAMLEKLYDPLVHLVRNGFDHGIEPPEIREELGKPKEATLEIRAFHRGSQIYIEVIDDGRGIDAEKVLAKAISKQVVTEAEAKNLSREQIYELLFSPGFSTADIISDLSGRGVGLDTVRSQVKALKGSINIISEPGKGTTFTIRLPLTLTITKLLVFSIQSRLMALPVDSLLAIVAAPKEQIQTLKNGKFYHWQEEFIPIYPQSLFAKHYALGDQNLEQPNALTLPTKGKVPLLMLGGDTQTIALPVDTILYEQELAIKPFSKTITPPPYLYGCTLLGNGLLVPVIDAQVLIASKQAEIVNQQKAKPSDVPPTVEEPTASNPKNTTILVIDDSLTTRQTLAAVLQKAGYRILQAKDGREALEQLAQAPEIQAAFCDIEMPRMNGFEFLNACRQEYSKDLLPVIMLSSRSNEKHRQVAKYMGANEYLTKPFFEHELLKTLGDLLVERSKHLTATDTQTPSLDLAASV